MSTVFTELSQTLFSLSSNSSTMNLILLAFSYCCRHICILPSLFNITDMYMCLVNIDWITSQRILPRESWCSLSQQEWLSVSLLLGVGTCEMPPALWTGVLMIQVLFRQPYDSDFLDGASLSCLEATSSPLESYYFHILKPIYFLTAL